MNKINLSDDKYVEFVPTSARDLKIRTNLPGIKKKYKTKREIEELNFNNDYVLKVGDEITVAYSNGGYSDYKISYITSNPEIMLHVEDLNRSALYLLPMLGGDRSQFRFKYYLSNVYCTICDELRESWGLAEGEYLVLKYRFLPDAQYRALEENLKAHKQFCAVKDCERWHTLFIFKVPKEFEEDVKLFKEGKYSKLSTKLKNAIKTFHALTNKDKVFKVIEKLTSYKKELEKSFEVSLGDSELDSIPCEDRETYK
jgi:hypothetical protein